MSLLFNLQHAATVQFTIGTHQDIHIGPELWEHLGGEQFKRLAVSIASPDSSSSRPNAVSCWAYLEPEAHGLTVPHAWIEAFHHVFSRDTGSSIVLTRTEPTSLTEVVIAALSLHAYKAALADRTRLETLLSEGQPFLRQGEIHTFPFDMPIGLSTPLPSRFRLDMTEPVLQGFAQVGKTRFILILEDDLDHSDASNEHLCESSETESEEGIEIDEGFLATSVWTSNPALGSFSPRARATDTKRGDVPLPLLESEFRATGLRQPVSHVHDSNCTVYVRTADLGRIGILNGDWAVAKPVDASKHRLVQVFAADHVVDSPGSLLCSPILRSNLASSTQLPGSSIAVTLQASPFGSNRPSIPTAQAITIARIASPLSTDRTYQALFLRGLKFHFEGKKPLVKQGDIIAVPIDTNSVTHEESESSSEDTALSYPIQPDYSNANVFFLVTNIEYDVLDLKESATSQDAYVEATIGELGCWVDSTVTRMVQTGVEHSRIPNVSVYTGIGGQTSSAFLKTLEKFSPSQLLSPASPFGKTLALSSATLATHAVDYNLHLSLLMKGSRGAGKFTVASWVAERLGMHLLEINCYDVIGDNDTKTEGTLRARFEKASTCSPCILVLRHIDALAQTTQALESGKEPVIANTLRDCMNELQQTWKLSGYPTLVFGTTSEPEKVPMGVLSCFKHEVAFEAPTEVERREMFECLLTECVLAPDVSVGALATQTAALVAADIVDLVTRAKVSSIKRVMSTLTEHDSVSEADIARAGVALTAADFDAALGKARAAYSESIGAPKIPNVSWDDVGGLAHVKSDILDTIQLPLEHPELFADGLKKRSGILLYGPPGTGKTLLAKAVATSCALNFFSIKGPELLNMYIGESEANVRKVFQRARDAKPCVIFFDELDSVAPKRGNQGDSGGVMDRIVSQLLAELDGMSAGDRGADVFVIGATNRPDLLDPALLRPGRFDRMLYLGVSDTHAAQLNILEALTRKFRLDPGLDLRSLAERCPFNYTGADFYALCSDAMLNAMSRKAEELEVTIAELNKQPGPYEHPHPLTPQYYLAEIATTEEMAVLVSQADFDNALRNLVPSVTQAEMVHYATIQQRFSRIEEKGDDTGEEAEAEVEAPRVDKGKGKARSFD